MEILNEGRVYNRNIPFVTEQAYDPITEGAYTR